MERVLTARALNRALLRRQHLLRRSKLSTIEMIEHLVGLQAQAPNPPYLGLWSRLHGFGHRDLADLLTERRVVRIALMRGTVHLVSAEDCLRLRPRLDGMLERAYMSSFRSQAEGLDLAALAAAARQILDEEPRTTGELGELLAQRLPGREPSALANAARAVLPLVQLPPRGVWGHGGRTRYATAQSWLGRALDPGPMTTMIERYLAAFGPATVADIQNWCGLTRLREVTDTMRGRLRTFRTENGAELLDVPDAPLPDPDTPAPPRFVAPFDNVLLSHAERTRIVAEEHRPALLTKNGIVPGTILVNGFVRGLWHIDRDRRHATLVVAPFSRLSKRDAGALESAGARMVAFFAEGAETFDLRIVRPD